MTPDDQNWLTADERWTEPPPTNLIPIWQPKPPPDEEEEHDHGWPLPKPGVALYVGLILVALAAAGSVIWTIMFGGLVVGRAWLPWLP